MANIEINELKPAGSQLFIDPEGFMNELSEDELHQTNGGFASDRSIVVNSKVKSACCHITKIAVA